MGSKVKAKVADGTLIVSLEDKIWMASLRHVSTATLEVREERGRHALLMKSGAALAEEIATFSSKGKAEDALEAVAHALTGGKRRGFLGRLLTCALVLAAVLGLLLLISGISRAPQVSEGMTSPDEITQQQEAPKSGVPLPADELLGQ